MKILHLQTISELTGIPIVERGTQESGNLENYMYLMEEHCKVPQGGGISAKTIYRNVYALCRWLNHRCITCFILLQPSFTYCLHFDD